MFSFVALEKFVCWTAVILLGGVFVAIARHALAHHINFQGMLTAKDGTEEMSPTRVQLLLFTIAYAIYYLMKVIHEPTDFPPIPHEVLYALTGSHGVYLAAKSTAASKLALG